MESENQDVAELQRQFSEMLKDLSFISEIVQRKSTRLLSLVERPELDVDSLEQIGIKIVDILKNLKGNSSVFIHKLYKSIDMINSNRPETENILMNMQSSTSACRPNVVVDASGEFKFADLVDSENMTEIMYEPTIDGNLSETSTSHLVPKVDWTNTISSDINSLSLKRESTSDTHQTEDGLWMDTLQRTSELHHETSSNSINEGNAEKTESTKSSPEHVLKFEEDSNKTKDEKSLDEAIENTELQKRTEDNEIYIISSSEDESEFSEEIIIPQSDNNNVLTEKPNLSEKTTKKSDNDSLNSNKDNEIKDKNNETHQVIEMHGDIQLETKDNTANQTETELTKNSSQKVDEESQITEENSASDTNNTTVEKQLKNDDLEETTIDDKYENPYSVETERVSSSGEDDELYLSKTVKLYDDHSYSTPLSDMEESQNKTHKINDKSTNKDISDEYRVTESSKITKNKEDSSEEMQESKLTSDDKSLDIVEENSKEFILHCDSLNEFTGHPKEQESGQTNKSTNDAETLNQDEGSKNKENPVEAETDLNDANGKGDVTDSESSEKKKDSIPISKDDESIAQDQLKDECSNRTNKIDENTQSQETYINTEHNYSSSNSPRVSCADDNGNNFDSDETDIDREVDHSQSINLNKLDNFSLEVSEEKSKPSRANSDKSFEFDISNYEFPDSLDGTNNRNENEVPEHNSTTETSNIKENETDYSSKNAPINADDFAKDLENLLNKSLHQNSELVRQSEKNNETISNDDLLDCTLEEFLSEGEEGCIQNSKNIKPDISKIKIENNDQTYIENNEIKTEFDTSDNRNIGDEILELLKEVPIVSVGDLQADILEIDDDSDASLKAEEILKDLNEYQSEISSSDDSDSDLNLDQSYFSTSSVDEEKEEEDAREIKKKLKECNITECYVPLERVEMSQKDIRKFNKTLDDDIDWLCDLKNLDVKRTKKSSPCFDKPPRKRGKIGSSSDTSTADSSSGCSDDEVNRDLRSDSPYLNSLQRERLDEILANAICNNLKSASSNDSDDSDSHSNSSTKNKKYRDEVKEIDKGDNKSEKRPLSKEELEKKAWRNDPLLRGKFSDSDSGKSGKPKKSKKYEDDSAFSLDSDHYNSDDSDEMEKTKLTIEDNKISPIKGNLPDSNTSDSDSDVQFISPKRPSSQNGESASPSQKGRRHIRSILSDRDLAKETLLAKKEEMERIERLKDRHKMIESMSQSFSSQQSEEEVVPLILDVDEESNEPLIQVDDIITKKMKPHQRDGVQFMWDSCYESLKMLKDHPGSGCILAHCMGLGKTFQVLALCHTLFSYDETDTKHILVVCPLSTVNNWKKEAKWAFQGLPRNKQLSLFTISGGNKKMKEKYEIVKQWHLRKKSVLVLGYECFESLTNDAKLDKTTGTLKQRILEYLVDPGPDLVICDEGHLIKNKKTLRTMALHKIETKRRIILTGTPLQNNLVEYYDMVHFVKPNLLGNIAEFKRNFVNPITNGQFEDSNEQDIKLMMKMTHVLHKVLLKTVQRIEDTELEIYLPPMVDHAVFIQLNQVQVDLYNLFSGTTGQIDVKRRKQFLSDFHMFQLICTHPHLLIFIEKQRNKKIKEKDVITNEDFQPVINKKQGWWKEKMPVDSLNKIDYGNKLVVLKAIIDECEAIGDKLLVFSQSLVELDLIEHFLKTVGTEKCQSWQKSEDYFRMDGTVSPEDRTNICDKFNDENRKRTRLLLMSTKVGGLGLNLTAANRVVIMTVHWNPSYDTQSVFRAYRFGQQKQVYVYRLISLDTMESKVYQRQVTKLAIAHRVVDRHHITRHYKSIDLQEMYSCKPNADDERPTPNVPEDEILAKVILKLPCIFKYHEHKALLADRPEDKLSEQELAAAWDDFKNNKFAFDALPPPQPQYVPQQNVPHGPNFNTAYRLAGPPTSATDLYYTPTPQSAGLSTNPQFRQMPNNYQQLSGSNKGDPWYKPYTVSASRQIKKLPTTTTTTNYQIPSTSKSIYIPENHQSTTTVTKDPIMSASQLLKSMSLNPSQTNQQTQKGVSTSLVQPKNTLLKTILFNFNKSKNVVNQPQPGPSSSHTQEYPKSHNTFVQNPKNATTFSTTPKFIKVPRCNIPKPPNLVKNPLHQTMPPSSGVQNNLSTINKPNTSTGSGIIRISRKENSVPLMRPHLSTGVKRKLPGEEILLKKKKNNDIENLDLSSRMTVIRENINEQNVMVDQINLTEDDIDSSVEQREYICDDVIQLF